jgi:two-component system, cell cycle sensor histidine kinase and response regulator CckA
MALPPSTILVVDDDPAILALTGAILRRAGYQVLSAEGGRQAVEVYESAAQLVGLLVTDVVMPDLAGPVLAARLRTRHPELRVLFISGYHDTQFVQRSLHNGFALLAKPFSPDSLLRAVRDSLDR